MIYSSFLRATLPLPLAFILSLSMSLRATNPLSKIQISSQSATCEKRTETDGKIHFTYEKKVLVTLADKSTIKAGKLDIILDESLLKPKNDTTMTDTLHPSTSVLSDLPPSIRSLRDHLHLRQGYDAQAGQTGKSYRRTLEKITFESNVEIAKGHRVANADRVEITPESNECHLYGNVVIKQLQKKKQVPIVTRGDHGILNLKTHRITLVGTEAAPVNTTIFLGKRHPKKKKS